MTTVKPVFLYFPLTGRAPAARIALFAAFGKDGWVNENIVFTTFKEEKKKLAEGVSDARLVSGSLPQLTIPSGKTFCQTSSIARWACSWALKNGIDVKSLYPVHDPESYIIMDESMTFAMEILDKCPSDADPEVKKTKREEYSSADGFMGRAMTILETRMTVRSGDFILGNDPSLADFTIYALTNMINVGQFDHVPADYLNKYPLLQNHLEAVKNCELMKKYSEAYGTAL